ncbi:MAG TPA: nuclear transport factor 2 family protein [Polyangiaceae bacterium]|nr:nuclear transport factor 2 family protein [Polyangiaceae bacterium]
MDPSPKPRNSPEINPSPLEIVQSFLAALSNGERQNAQAFYAENVEQVEFPNRLVGAGARRGLPELREASERGARAVSSERYVIRNAVEMGERVAVELEWSAVLNVPLGSIPAGGTLRAACAMFFTVREGRIVRQHNYDCFDPF